MTHDAQELVRILQGTIDALTQAGTTLEGTARGFDSLPSTAGEWNCADVGGSL